MVHVESGGRGQEENSSADQQGEGYQIRGEAAFGAGVVEKWRDNVVAVGAERAYVAGEKGAEEAEVEALQLAVDIALLRDPVHELAGIRAAGPQAGRRRGPEELLSVLQQPGETAQLQVSSLSNWPLDIALPKLLTIILPLNMIACYIILGDLFLLVDLFGLYT